MWVYRFVEPRHSWTLSVATHAPPGSGKLSLGGFRILPEDRLARKGFSTDVEAVSLAAGMEEKVYWSRLIGVGGPLTIHDINRIVGGKCVLAPTPDARIGQPLDEELLDFAIACFREVERVGGFLLTTGQDLGHGLMSDGITQSLDYLNARYKGSVVADTSDLTAIGNYHVLRGMLRGMGIPLEKATVGLIGYGNIGGHLVNELSREAPRLLALEAREDRCREMEARGITAWHPEKKSEFLSQPMDALVVNASGGSLDAEAVSAIAANPGILVVCGCENLAMPDPSQELVLHRAGKIYAPTELGGMMGYLTAAEEYLSRLEGVALDRPSLVVAASRLEEAALRGTERVRESGVEHGSDATRSLSYKKTFAEAVTEIYATSTTAL